jgi:histidinol dehydrogenase
MRRFSTEQSSIAEIVAAVSRPVGFDAGDMEAGVREIIEAVRARGDDAVVEYTRRWDWPEMTADRLRVPAEEIEAARRSVAPELARALEAAYQRIIAYHRTIVPADTMLTLDGGARLGERFTPIRRVGVHVPAARGDYPSSLFMSVCPAQVAGVREIAVCIAPRPDGSQAAATLAAAGIAGIGEVYRMGGVQALAAFAFATATVAAVDKIAGPGRAEVMLAKKFLYPFVGTDGFYGPSEVVIIADDSADPQLVAADLLSQGEHGPGFVGVVATPSERLIDAVILRSAKRDEESPPGEIPRSARNDKGDWLDAGLSAVHTRDLDEAAAVANGIAPEHLELMVADPEALLPRIENAGAIFLGPWAPVPVGDYYAGPSHVLPTGGTARFSSGLGVMDFMKRSHVIETSREWLDEHGANIVTMAEAEGFSAHAEAIRIRMRRKP